MVIYIYRNKEDIKIKKKRGNKNDKRKKYQECN